AGFRNEVLGYLENESHAVSPELGVDMGIVAAVCAYAKRRVRRFEWLLFGAAVLGLAAASIDPALGAIVMVTASAAVYFVKEYGGRVSLVEPFRKENFDAVEPDKAFPVALEASVRSALPRDDQNLVIYTGFQPFVGAGVDLGGWSFVTDVSKPADRFVAPQRFDVDELHRAIDGKVASSQLEGLVIKDFHFVSGRDIRNDRDMLPDAFGRPSQRLDPEAAKQHAAAGDPRVRHYRWI